MWFPETTRALTCMGAEVILHPSMTPTVDRDAELSIMRATAVTKQCYVFDINGVGAGGNGRSIIVGPEGMVLHQAGNGEEMIPLEIEIDRVRVSRERGLMRLGQVLKSFRDSKVDFSQTYGAQARLDYLDSLGPLAKPQRMDPLQHAQQHSGLDHHGNEKHGKEQHSKEKHGKEQHSKEKHSHKGE
jgi:hypothetical protein